MRKKLGLYLNRQNFFPTFLGFFFNPFWIARRGLASAMKDFSAELHGKLLDVGCGSKPYESLFNVSSYIGLDIENEGTIKRGVADYFYDGGQFPFGHSEFDSVLCNQVLEHVFNPDDFIGEINRVLKPAGKLLLTVPFVWDEHEQPYDYARYSSFGLRSLLEKNGFIVLDHRKLGTDMSTLFQLTNAYLYKVTLTWPKLLRNLNTMTTMAFISMAGVLCAKLFPENSDLFLDHIILVQKQQ